MSTEPAPLAAAVPPGKVGALAEWLHNMARFSGEDFQGFDEQRFWQEYERLRRRFPDFNLVSYQNLLERRLVELRTGKWPNPD